MNALRIEYNITLNNIDYILYLGFNEKTLELVLEIEKDTNYWKGNFESNYIEDMTLKAGSSKSFQVFLKMLQSALTNDSNSVKLDILGFSDLEQMRNKQLNSSNNTSSTNNDFVKQNKKYLIVIYSEFQEKVNFPLSLNYLVEPDFEIMKKTIERLKKPRKSIKTPVLYSNMSDIDDLRKENFNLINKIKFLESQKTYSSSTDNELHSDMKYTQKEFESYVNEADKKKRFLMETIEELKLRLNNDKKQVNYILPNNNEKSINRIKDLEDQIISLNNVLIKERKKFEKKILNINGKGENLESEILFLRENDTKMRIKINQIEKEIELTEKKCKEVSFGKSKNKILISTPRSNASHKSSYSYGSKKSIISSNSKGSEISKNTKTSINTQNLVDRLKPKSNNKYNVGYNNYFTNKAISPNTYKKSPSSNLRNKPPSIKGNLQPKNFNVVNKYNTNKPKSIASTNISLKPNNNFKKPLNSGDISDKLNRIQNLLNNAKI